MLLERPCPLKQQQWSRYLLEKKTFSFVPPPAPQLFCEAVGLVFPCLCQGASFLARIFFPSMMHTKKPSLQGECEEEALALRNIHALHGWAPGLAPDLLIQGWGHPSALLIISLLNGCPSGSIQKCKLFLLP